MPALSVRREGVLEDRLQRRTACRPRDRCGRRHSEDLRALRLLHGRLSDLRADPRRERSAARAYRSHQGDVGKRRTARPRDGRPYRQLPVLQQLHDDLRGRRGLSASVRHSPRPYRGELPPAARRPSAARDDRTDDTGSRPFRPHDPSGPPRPADPGAVAAPPRQSGRSGAGLPAARSRPDRCSSRPRSAAAARRPAAGLRSAGAGPGDQRGDDSAAHPARLRGCGAGCGGLLRRVHPPHGQGGDGDGCCCAGSSMPGPRSWRPAAWMPSRSTRPVAGPW